MTPGGTRIEKDSLGEMAVPAGAYYGIQTARAVENFPISGLRAFPEFIRAYVCVKKAAALVNRDLGLLEGQLTDAIVKAADEVLAGKLLDQFVVDVFQAGAGTSTNMNVNEVLANRAIELLGGKRGDYSLVSPNDHVNMSQSTNDSFPTAMRVALLWAHEALVPELKHLEEALRAKGREFADVITSARTHLQDAVPITLGQEFTAWGETMRKAVSRLERASDSLRPQNLGGTAAGTGLNAHPEYARRVVARLSEIADLELEEAPDPIEIASTTVDFADYSGALRTLALDLTKIANDLRLLSSGPTTGLAEIVLPAVQPGSSIMPGKVNPSIPECLNQICYHVLGADTAVSYCTQAGQLQLNVMMPVLLWDLLFAVRILTTGVRMFADRCVAGITVDRERCRTYFEDSGGLGAVLNPVIGYMKAAEIVKESRATGKSVPDLIVEKGLMTKEEVRKAFAVERLTKPGTLPKRK